ncbi:unnamed protein product [Linum trigynum]|uniref:Glycosyltransferase n=1 Tax=Linum trigynum TaxID=586398 RepID=A0AAV2CNH1_9ROSI
MEQVDSSPAGNHHHHALLFPFMSKGHTIPLLHLARLLLRRHITVTVVTTPANRPFISQSLSSTASAANILTIPFSHNIPEIPAGTESSDALPSMSLFYPFASSTVVMQPAFDAAIETLTPPATFMVSDGFLWWTLESANRIRIPRLVSFGMSAHAMSLGRAVGESGILWGPESHEELIALPQFPWMKVSKSDFEPFFYDREAQQGVDFDFVMLAFGVAAQSHGFVLNTFYGLEKAFVDYVNSSEGPTSWCVGPLCLAEPMDGEVSGPRPTYMDWLDQKYVEGESVLFVAFGSQADISLEQLKEIAAGLEDSGANFLWVLRDKEAGLLGKEEVTRFEERVEERGKVVKGWAKQREILGHKSVKGFMSHCGWNSVMESVCAGVPVAAWPMAAEQPMNARMVVEEMKVGVRVETCDGSVRGFVKRDGVTKAVKELMEGERGRKAAERAAELGEAARGAMEEGSGSSWVSLDKLIHETMVGVNKME